MNIAMKNKSLIGLFAAVFALALTTSCEDMLTVDSNRVVYEEEHTLGSTADSVYTTNGILQSLQQIADRYILLGELRGDLVDVNNLTQTDLRRLSEFNFSTDNSYVDPTDYYAVINNCNYLLKHMDISHKKNGKFLMKDEYAGALSIRAWTYMQLAINYGKVPFFTEPLTQVADAEDVIKNVSNYMDISAIAEQLTPELIEYVDVDMPCWASVGEIETKYSFPPIKLILGELFLWSGNYDEASFYFMDYIVNRNDNASENFVASSEGTNHEFEGYIANLGQKLTYSLYNKKLSTIPTPSGTWQAYTDVKKTNPENLCSIVMSVSKEDGTVSSVNDLFYSRNATHQLIPSAYWTNLNNEQSYCRALEGNLDRGESGYTEYVAAGDARGKYYLTDAYTLNGKEYTPINKFNPKNQSSSSKEVIINLYRRSVVYLRLAEALTCYAKQEYVPGDSVAMAHASEHVEIAFNLMKDAYLAFLKINEHAVDPSFASSPEARLTINNDTAEFVAFNKVLRKNYFQGIHARGCGDIHLDTVSYTLKPEAIAKYLHMPIADLTFDHTIQYVEGRILDELALEAAFEGNRFGDLVRFAKRSVEPEVFFAERIATRGGTKNLDLYNKLLDESNWYLPLPEK